MAYKIAQSIKPPRFQFRTLCPTCMPTSAVSFFGDRMKQIPLTQGQFAIVDDMFEWLNQWKWCAAWYENSGSFYAVRTAKDKNGKKHTISMAREILGLKYGDKRQADHIGHITLDNRRSNLRIATHQQNKWNSKNSKGYYWCESRKKYLAHIGVNSKIIHLGYYHTAKQARNAYLEAKKHYHIY